MKKLVITILCASFAIYSFSQERSELRKNSPNRIVLNVGGGVFSNYTYDWNDDDWDSPKFHIGNLTYSGMLGYRTGIYKNRENLFAIFYQGGSIDAEGLSGLDKDEMKIFIENLFDPVRFTELQVGVVWRRFLRVSGGRGFVRPIENIDDLENLDYTLLTTGINLRFGRFLGTTFNWTLMSADNFKTPLSRFDIQICYFLFN